MKTIEFTYHLKDIDATAARVLEYLESKILLFKGEMGAGKTTLINALLKAMHSEDVATSPTFSIVNEYSLPNDKLYHFDFYRIESLEEAFSFGLEDYLSGDNWLFMEWPERIESLLPDNTQIITITQLEEDIRHLKLTINKNNLTKNKALTVSKL